MLWNRAYFVNSIIIKGKQNINIRIIAAFFVESKNTRETSHVELELCNIKLKFSDFPEKFMYNERFLFKLSENLKNCGFY